MKIATAIPYSAGRLRRLAEVTLPSPQGNPVSPRLLPQEPVTLPSPQGNPVSPRHLLEEPVTLPSPPGSPVPPHPTPKPLPPNPRIPEPPPDTPPARPELPPLGKALTRLPAPAAGAIFGVGWLGLPLAGGIMGGLPGALVGGAASLGFNYALDRNINRAALFSAGSTLLAAGIPAHPWTALEVAGFLALTAALGAGLTWGGKFEDWLEPR